MAEIRRQGFGRVGLYFASKLGIPDWPVKRCIRIAKIVAMPSEYVARRAGARAAQPTLKLDRNSDYAANLVLPGTNVLVAHCRELLARKRGELTYTVPYTFVTEIKRDDEGQRIVEPDEMRSIVDFASQKGIVDIVTDYMGEIPVLSTISLIYTPINDNQVGPQNFHRDLNCVRQLHLIVNIEDVDEGSGPFTFVSGAASRRVAKAVRHFGGRVSDEEIQRRVALSEILKCTGPAGTAFLVNPFACFHFGARARSRPRYILILNYSSLFEWAEGLGSVYRSRNRAIFDNGDPLRKRLLALS